MRLDTSAMAGRHVRRVALARVGPADTIERQQDRLEIDELKRHVANLGSFKEGNLAEDYAKAWLWQRARRRLDQLGICGKITSREREKIEAALAQRVPTITQEHEATCYREPE